jgi:CheY-like chemotaxis protein
MAHRILVVEDDSASRSALAELLRDEGYEVETARSGREAVVVVEAWRPDVILSDVLMPGGGGLELADRLRKSTEWQDIPVLLFSAWDLPEAVPAGLEEVVASSMEKPIDFEALLTRIRERLPVQ